MQKNKEEIKLDLIIKAREILKNKGLEYLTARKLSDYSGYSVGTIYNQFKSMDVLIMWENCQTLDELNLALQSVELSSDVYQNLNRLLDKFVDFIFENKNIWFTLYNFHFNDTTEHYKSFYLKRILKLLTPLESNIHKLFPDINSKERHLTCEVLFTSLFALSSLLTTQNEFSRISKRYVTKLLFNTYLAGISYLK